MHTFSYELGETLLAIESISKAYGDITFNEDGTIASAEHLILYDVNAIIRNIKREGMQQGQVVGLLGPSGKGKTQLFKILAGLIKPTTGAVLFNSERRPVQPGMMGVVPQHYPLLEPRTVLKNLVMLGCMAGLTKAESKDKAMQYLEKFGIAHMANAWPCILSGGQRQRVAIAQQLMRNVQFLLMDEPFSGLDPLAVEKVTQAIQEIATSDELRTILIITHEVSAAVTNADTLWLMGNPRDENGQSIPGARIVDEINLVDLGLAWHKDINQTTEFLTFVRDMKLRFREL